MPEIFSYAWISGDMGELQLFDTEAEAVSHKEVHGGTVLVLLTLESYKKLEN